MSYSPITRVMQELKEGEKNHLITNMAAKDCYISLLGNVAVC